MVYGKMASCRFGLILGSENQTWHLAQGLPQPPGVPDVAIHLSPRLFTCPQPSLLVSSLASHFMGSQVPFPQRVRERYIPNPKLTFYDQCREVMRFKQLALRSEDAYLQWIKRFVMFHRQAGSQPGK